MSDIKDGGPAFPVPEGEDKYGDVQRMEPGHRGMSLRDWFAGQAVMGICVDARQDQSPLTKKAIPAISEMAYLIADAMIAQREKGAKS